MDVEAEVVAVACMDLHAAVVVVAAAWDMDSV